MSRPGRILAVAMTLVAALAAAPPVAGQTVEFNPDKAYELEIVTWTADKETEGRTWQWLVSEYQRFRPNVTVHKTIQSNRTYAQWATTQFKSGQAPDVMQSFSWKAHQWGAEQGLLVPMRRFLNQPNPHDDRDRPSWMSGLYEELLELNADPYFGEIWTIPISLNTQRFYYNKDVFKQYDLAVPRSFSELGEACRLIRRRSSGRIVPIAMAKTGAWLDYLGVGVNGPLLDDYDLVKRNAQLTKQEVVIAALRGQWDSRSDAMYSFHRLLKKMSDQGWFQHGWEGFDQNQADNLFTNGKAAMIREGYWMNEGFRQRIAGEFEFGIMPEPYIDKEFTETDRDIGHMLELMGSYGSELAVTKQCEERGRLAAAIDFLQWMTSPEIARQVSARRGAMPSTRDLDEKLPPDVLAFKPEVGGRPGGPMLYMAGPGTQMQACMGQVAPLYVTGQWSKTDLKDFMSNFHGRFIDLAVEETREASRTGIFKATRLYGQFMYRQEDLRRRIEAAPDSRMAGSLRTQRRQALDSAATTVSKLRDTEDMVKVLIPAAWPEQRAAAFRHEPMIDDQLAAHIGQLATAGGFVALVGFIVWLLRKQRLTRIRSFPEKTLYLFLVPCLLFIVSFRYYPAFSGIYHAFTRWDGVTIDEFIGLSNFGEMLRDDILHTSIVNLAWMMGAMAFKLVPPLAIAVVIYHVASERLRYYARVMFVLPLVVPGIVYWMVWKLLYKPAPSGIFNQVLMPIESWVQSLGLDVTLVHNWLADPRTALGAIIFLGFPFVNTLGVLIYLAGLENIDPNLFEAADIDGAGWLKKFWYIELPLLMRQVKLNLVLGLITTVQGFGMILFLTQGGPAYSTTVPGYQMYTEAFDAQRMGYASAIGLVMFIVILVLTLGTGKAVKPQD